MQLSAETANYILDTFPIRRARVVDPSTRQLAEIDAVCIDLKAYHTLPGLNADLFHAAHAGKMAGGQTALFQYVRNSVGDTDKTLILDSNLGYDDYRVNFSASRLREIAGITLTPARAI